MINTSLQTLPLDVAFQQAIAHHQAGQLQEAEQLYRAILQAQPFHPDANHNLGVLAAQANQPAAALPYLKTALESNPNQGQYWVSYIEVHILVGQTDAARLVLAQARQRGFNGVEIDRLAGIVDNAVFYFDHGFALHELKQLGEAVASYDRAIRIKPDYAEAYSNRGLALQALKQLYAAVASYDRAISIKPNFAEAYFNRGTALQELKQFDAAVDSYDRAISIKPGNAEAYFNRGTVLQELKHSDAAVDSYDRAISIKPDYADAYYNRGLALQKIKQLDVAVVSYDQAICIKPNFAEAYANRGTALQKLNQLDAAVASYDRAISIKPDFAEVYFNRGLALHELKQLDAALASYDRAISIMPDYAEAYWDKSLTLLLNGHFGKGWELYEWRWKAKQSELKQYNFPQPLWLGAESLKNKTILLHCEQGLGDTIQFCRYAKLVAAQEARVIFEVPKVLMGLLHGLDGVSEWIENGSSLPQFDYHCPLLSLPFAFKTSLDTIPSAQTYLYSDATKVEAWRNKLGDKTKPRVGIVWSGNADHKNDHNRSISLSSLLRYLPNSVEYISLQKELCDFDKMIVDSKSIRHFGEELVDYTDTAALCESMDVIISVDTSVAHLSGALGKNIWILLPYSPDWRWLLNRNDSPWYPSVKLYRQERIGDWDSVFERVKADLLLLA